MTVTYGSTNTAVVTASGLNWIGWQSSILVNGVSLGKDSTSIASVARILLNSTPTLVGTTAAASTGINASSQNTVIVPYLVGEATSTTGGVGTASGTPDTFVTYNATTGLRPLNPTDEFTNNTITTGNNTRVTLATTASASTSINSLVITGATGLTPDDWRRHHPERMPAAQLLFANVPRAVT